MHPYNTLLRSLQSNMEFAVNCTRAKHVKHVPNENYTWYIQYRAVEYLLNIHRRNAIILAMMKLLPA